MKRYLAIFAVALSLGGCAGTLPSLVENALSLPVGVLTQSVNNPVTPQVLYQVENGLRATVAGLRIYERNCWASVPAGEPAACKRATRTLKGYARKLPPLLESAYTFVNQNDQVNAKIVYATIMETVGKFRNTAIAAGVQ